jgi:hypothetical protein
MGDMLTSLNLSLNLLIQLMQIGSAFLALGSFALLILALIATELGRNIICGVCFGIFELTRRLLLVLSSVPWYKGFVIVYHAIVNCLFFILNILSNLPPILSGLWPSSSASQASPQVLPTPQPLEQLPTTPSHDESSPDASPIDRTPEPYMTARCCGVTRDPGPDGDYRCHRVANIEPSATTGYYCSQHVKQKVARRFFN